MIRERSLFENIKILIFLMVVAGVYLLRYFVHETNVTKVEEYYPVALMATGVFYILLFLLFAMILKKGGESAPVWCMLFGALSFATFLHRNTLGGVYLYLSIVFILMAMICVWGSLLFLLVPLFAIGVYIYPGFFLMGAPLLLGALGYQAKIRPLMRIVIIAGIILGGIAFYMGIHSELPLWGDSYEIMSKFHPYMEFAGMENEEYVHTAKVLELIIFTVMLSPYIYMYLRLLHEVHYQAKYLSFLLAGVLPLIEYISQEHPGQVMYFIVAYYMIAVILPIAWGDAVWIQALREQISRIKAMPGWIIFVIYPMCLFPLRRGMICLASRWVTRFIMFRLFGVEV